VTGVPSELFWEPGQPIGARRFAEVVDDEGPGLPLERGGSLPGVTVAYETWGTPDATGSNAVLVLHALTGDSHAAGPKGSGHATPGWWDPLIGPHGRPSGAVDEGPVVP
jgi:homoserine O-acetyltransferase